MINIAVCDNNEEERNLLVKVVEDIIKVYGVSFRICEFSNGQTLLKTDLNFQLVFLETVFDGEDGIELGHAIYQRNHRIKIIYQTSCSRYCKEAINHAHAFAYLKKPLIKAELKEQIECFLECKENIQEERVEFWKVICVHKNEWETKPLISLLVRDIMYFAYLKNQKKIKIVTKDAQYIYASPMNAVEERMKPFGFEISCRGILVNLQNVVKVNRYEILLKNGEVVTLSQKRVKNFKMKMKDYMRDIQIRSDF